MGAERAVEVARERGWDYRENDRVFVPREERKRERREGEGEGEVPRHLLHRLTEYAAFLEENIATK